MENLTSKYAVYGLRMTFTFFSDEKITENDLIDILREYDCSDEWELGRFDAIEPARKLLHEQSPDLTRYKAQGKIKGRGMDEPEANVYYIREEQYDEDGEPWYGILRDVLCRGDA